MRFWGSFVVLFSFSALASNSLAVNFPSCDESWILKDGLLERLRFELAPSGITDVSVGPFSDERVFSQSTLVLVSPQCDAQVELRLFVPPFASVSRRLVSLQNLSTIERTRLISLVAAELLTVAPKRIALPGTQEFSLKELGIVTAKIEPPDNNCFGSVSLGVNVLASMRSGLFFLNASGGCKVSNVLQYDLGIRGSIGSNQTDLGAANTQFLAAKTVLSVYSRSATRYKMSLGVGLEMGWLHVEGIAKDATVIGKSQSAFAMIPSLVSSIEAPFAGNTKLKLGIEVGYALVGIESRAQGLPIGGIAGSSVSISTGIGF